MACKISVSNTGWFYTVILSICWNLTDAMWTDSTVLVMVGMASCSHGDTDQTESWDLWPFFVCVGSVWNWTLFHSCWKKHVVNNKKNKWIIVNISAPVKSTLFLWHWFWGFWYHEGIAMLHNCRIIYIYCVNRIKLQKVFTLKQSPQSTFTSNYCLRASDTLLNWGLSLFTIFFLRSTQASVSDLKPKNKNIEKIA